MALVNCHNHDLNGGGAHPLVHASIWRNEREHGAFHNHPSGDPTPSPEDRALTTRLRDAGELLGIRLLDHLILGDD